MGFCLYSRLCCCLELYQIATVSHEHLCNSPGGFRPRARTLCETVGDLIEQGRIRKTVPRAILKDTHSLQSVCSAKQALRHLPWHLSVRNPRLVQSDSWKINMLMRVLNTIRNYIITSEFSFNHMGSINHVGFNLPEKTLTLFLGKDRFLMPKYQQRTFLL